MMRVVANLLLALAVIGLVALGDVIAPPHAVSFEDPRIRCTDSDLPAAESDGAPLAAA